MSISCPFQAFFPQLVVLVLIGIRILCWIVKLCVPVRRQLGKALSAIHVLLLKYYFIITVIIIVIVVVLVVYTTFEGNPHHGWFDYQSSLTSAPTPTPTHPPTPQKKRDKCLKAAEQLCPAKMQFVTMRLFVLFCFGGGGGSFDYQSPFSSTPSPPKGMTSVLQLQNILSVS